VSGNGAFTYDPRLDARDAETLALALAMIRDEAGQSLVGIGGIKDQAWCAGVAMSALASVEERHALGECFWHPGEPFTMGLTLCDDKGIVRSGRFHKGTDYNCTGGAHFAGEHIRCTSPAHDDRPGPDWKAIP
jgi:hypothetical protein